MKKIKLTYFVLVFLLILNTNVYAKEVLREEFSPGATRVSHDVNYQNKKVRVEVIELDLNNPYLNLKVIAGDGKYTQRATVSSMAKRTNAEALVNADYFNMILQGAPDNASIIDGRLVSSPSVYTDRHTLGITSDNRAIIDTTYFEGKVVAANNASYPIDGLNRSYYWYDGTGEYSHENKIQVYNDFWASASRGEKKNSEVLVNSDGTVEAISQGKNFNFPVPDGKQILQVDGQALNFINANVKVGDKIKVDYKITPDYNFKFMVGGHALLVNNGQAVKYTKDINVLGGRRARTAAGISADGKKIYLAAAEGRTSRSAGLTLGELSDFMISIGCNKAVNLDGGGSTAMVLKELGSPERTRVINPEKNSAERKVVSGIGIFNTAPVTGVPKGIKFKGPDSIVVGESALYTVVGAWDENLHPVDTSSWTYQYNSSNPESASFFESYLLGLTPGSITATLSASNGLTATKEITVKGFDEIVKLNAKVDKKRISDGETLNVTTEATLKDGRTVVLSPKVLSYSLDGFVGNFDENGNLVITSTADLYKANINVSVGDKTTSTTIYDASAKVIEMTIDKKQYSINSEKQKMDTAPFIKDSRTLVPVRFVAEAIGAQVEWNEEEQLVKITNGENILTLKIGENSYNLNGKDLEMDTQSIIKDSRTFIPIRFVAEALGLNVEYNDSTRTVTLIDIK
ncbi:Copper amine oxidase N-terminal domain-containing protein [Peptoniphilus asaccharolyticus DSM 20463]|uniref:Copper amine oxidase N-terminal domain-containing protein n=1 Tax=Peptoniphilus asaccharolyticus DSM 20463 TaxID=573058 RepID=A0A1W1UBX6_PEPAS|nr:stalk domain-containing protein [Peptoniphilus asaccharolyticus]MBL7575569.1 phosphodiester glycosidase family protein [Peptoniphilus asaccharolyticus]SMB78294.1 Copper amine oxidase N-terminal domain-containing protein [Peptoniphilus asaccharolyticus DSM 20463]